MNLFLKYIFLSVLITAFIGQPSASPVMSCDMENSNHSGMTDKNMMKMDDYSTISHQAMNNNTQMSNSTNNNECCDAACVCPVNACSSVVYIPLNTNLITPIYTAELASTQNLQQPISVLNSLFRPPIFA